MRSIKIQAQKTCETGIIWYSGIGETIYMAHVELIEREMLVVSAFAKHIKMKIEECRDKPDRWGRVLKELDEFIMLTDRGLTSKLVNKIYRSCPL